MNKREKLIAALLLCLLGAWGGRALYGRYTEAAERSETALEAARNQLIDAKITLRQGERAMKQLEAWQKMSLPPDISDARSMYRAWILKEGKEAGLNVEEMSDNQQRTTNSPAYKSISYTIKARRGSLSSLIKFLYEFYRRAQLQQITRLDLLSTAGSQDLGITMQIEALILPGATHEESLPDGQSDRLKLASVEEYEKQITSRDLFKPYTPPRPPSEERVANTPPRPPAAKFDDASQAKVTGILNANADSAEAWIKIFTTGVLLRLHEGDEFEVGTLKGTVESIEPRAIILKTADDKQLRVKLGSALLEPEEQAASENKAESDKPAAPAES